MKNLIVILLFWNFSCFAQEGRVIIKIVDSETGESIPSATIEAGFKVKIPTGLAWSGGGGSGYNDVKGGTDPNGICVLTGSGDGGSIVLNVFAEQYYAAGPHVIDFTGTSGLVFKRWEPWDQKFTVKLQRIGSPIPLYAKRLVQEKYPQEEGGYGYDLMVGDWVKPHGKGEIADVIFETTKKDLGSKTIRSTDYPLFYDTFTISFSGKDSGLIPVIPEKHLALPLREAPEHGYQKTFIRYSTQEEKEGMKFLQRTNNDNPDRCFYFRIRVEHDEQGKIKSALYGKVYGDFEMHYSGWINHSISFTYYLNPTPNDRNLEYDHKQNLFNPDTRAYEYYPPQYP